MTPSAVTEASVLLVEDDRALAQVLELALSARGYSVVSVATGAGGLEAASVSLPDVVVLDLGLPDLDGIEVCRQLRRWYLNPIVVLSADGDEVRKITALDAGADDYVTKPFSMPEVLARVRVALRHRQAVAAVADDAVLRLGPLVIDTGAREVAVDGERIELARMEYELLLLLAHNAGKVLTHQALARRLWPGETADRSESLRWHIMRVRKKLGTGVGAPHLLTEPGVGYRLTVTD
jgi:two-component system KDP operon response regulator KdpE